MTSRSRSPEKRKPTNLRDAAHLDQFRGSGEAAARRIDRGNPQTPPAQKFVSSTYSSPGSILGREEDVVILELTNRFLLAGIEGESCPQCKISFGPANSRRAGDYREWLPEYRRAQQDIESWGSDYELWRNDIHDLDLGLVGDKLERSVREAYNKYLLLDAGLARVVLVLPSIVPHPVLDTFLSTLFQRWKFPSITLLPAPTMAALSAGLRSALVVDIGWEETTATVIHELRETRSLRSTRCMKMLSTKLAEALLDVKEQRPEGGSLRFDLDFIDDVLNRALPLLRLNGDDNLIDGEAAPTAMDESASFEMDWPSETSSKTIQIPCSTISNAIDQTLFAGANDQYADDEEIAVSRLVFECLLGLSADTRAACVSRIVFTGYFASHQGVKSRVLRDLEEYIKRHGWTPVKGTRLKPQRYGLAELAQARTAAADASHSRFAESGKDYVEDRVRQAKAKRNQDNTVSADVREVASLGSWAGASLMTSFKVRGFVEIDKDRYLSQGIMGASRDVELSVVAQPQRLSSFGLAKNNKIQDRSSWTLAGWG